MKALRYLSGFMLFLLAFAPLSSCALKTEHSDTGVAIVLAEDNELANKSENLQVTEIRVMEFRKDSEEMSQGVTFLVALAISVLGVGIKSLLLKPFVWFAIFISFLSYVFHLLAVLMSQVVTPYGYLFIIAGVVFYTATAYALIPKRLPVFIT